MLLESWIRIAMLAGMWLFLATVLIVGLARWFRYQRRMDQREAAARQMYERQILDLLEPKSKGPDPKTTRWTSPKSQDS